MDFECYFYWYTLEHQSVINTDDSMIGGFVLQGKVFQNRMIDLMITNTKLFHRACGIVSRFGNVDIDEARVQVLRAIYGLESLQIPQDIDTAPLSDHVKRVNMCKFIFLFFFLESNHSFQQKGRHQKKLFHWQSSSPRRNSHCKNQEMLSMRNQL
jgi:hypothetical protein